MSKFVILAGAGSDLSQEYMDKYNIAINPGHVQFPDRKEIVVGTSWIDYDKDSFYTKLKKDPMSYSTSPANVEEIAEIFEGYAKEGKDILSVTLSSGISGAYNFEVKAKEQVEAKYPDVKIHVIDSLRFGPGYGLMVVHAAKLRDEGKTIDEVVSYLEENKNRYHQTGWLDDLSFVAKKGRLTNAKAFFGTLAGVKPLGEFDYNGLTTVLAKVKGAKMAYKVLLDYMEREIENPTEQEIFIAHSQRGPQAEKYKEMIEERFNPKAVHIIELTMVNAVNVGPGLMAAYYVGKPISEDLSEEKKAFEEIIEKNK